MKTKKQAALFLASILCASLLAGCKGSGAGQEERQKDEREKVTIAFWGDQLTEHYGAYLQDEFPDVELEFYVATNSTDFYRFKEELGDLPDILTVRRFSLNDVADWKDSLMDLSDSQLANSFYQTYLRNYTYDDGTVNWLPACAEVDSIIMNKKLLEANGIEIPVDYQGFVETCAQLKDLGIQPFISDFGADYTCMEILQGLSVSQLASQEGREWRQMYESGQTDQLSEQVWLPVFERMLEFIDYAGIDSSFLEKNSSDVNGAYERDEAAMFRGTGADAARYAHKESVIMPYYGETAEDSWYLTYPAFQVAASKRAEESPERKQLILDIMEAMLNEEGLRHITNGQDMIPYNKDAALELSPAMEYLQPYIDSNRLYIRLASSDMFSVSQQVVRGMLTGEYPDARSAFDGFNEALRRENQEEPVIAAHIDTGYSYSFDPDGGSKAASAVVNSFREEVGTQMLICQSTIVAGDITAGDYTEEQLGFLTMAESSGIMICDMTGEQLSRYVDYVLTTPGKRGSVVNDSTLYVSSGFEMEVRKTEKGYELEKLTVEGKDMDPAAVYSTAVIGSEVLMQKEALAAVGITDYTRLEKGYKKILTDRLGPGGKQLAQPTDYITLK